MSQERLNGLIHLHVHKDINVDCDAVIDRFASSNRLINFIL
jgi:hypothetical protein